MYENLLIKYCSPTLASLKVANLFTYFNKEKIDGEILVKSWNKILLSRGIKAMVLCNKCNSSLIYVYRPKLLYKQINEPDCKNFLENLSYNTNDLKKCLEKLKIRVREDCFPHEIGIFLGYPFEDVEGFIKNKGRNHICCGCWKVYKNKNCKEKLFNSYKKAKSSYTNLYAKGWNIERLCVKI